jgi:hypothetical protein
MKQTLPLLFTLFLALTINAQTSFSDRLAFNFGGDHDKVELQVYPNPATEYISINENSVVREIKIYNLVGRQMKSFEYANGERHYVGDLPRGMYLVQMIGSNDKILKTQRVNKR